MSLDVELIDRCPLILYATILLDFHPRELLDDILEVAVTLPCEGFDPVAQRVATDADRLCFDMHLTYSRGRRLETNGEGISCYGADEYLLLGIAQEDEGEALVLGS